MQDYQSFALQCQNEIQLPNSIAEKQEQNLATQVHQIVWHSATHNFAFPIAYYGINIITAHNLNTLLFNLAARLECIGIHTYGSICDGAGENRTHIKSFDWYASTWSSGDVVEVNFNKNKKSFHVAEIINSNLERTKFTVCLHDGDKSEKITVDRTFIRPPMPSKLEWNVNELCEFKSPKDNQWYLGKITNFDSIESTLSIEITNENRDNEGWKVFNYHIDKFLRPVYDDQKLLMNHKTINPITGEEWFFISDPTHVFKKLRNNLSKSHIGEKNSREIMYNGKEISWKHIKGVYEHTQRHATAKATKLTKRHIWLTSWSKIRVDLVEHTLSKEVECALASIEELKDISKGTRVRFY
jgi:Agenet domain